MSTPPEPPEPAAPTAFAPDVDQLRRATHDLANVAGVVLANWHVVKESLRSNPSAWVIAVDIDIAGARLAGSIATLIRLLEPPPAAPGTHTPERVE